MNLLLCAVEPETLYCVEFYNKKKKDRDKGDGNGNVNGNVHDKQS